MIAQPMPAPPAVVRQVERPGSTPLLDARSVALAAGVRRAVARIEKARAALMPVLAEYRRRTSAGPLPRRERRPFFAWFDEVYVPASRKHDDAWRALGRLLARRGYSAAIVGGMFYGQAIIGDGEDLDYDLHTPDRWSASRLLVLD